MINDDDIRQRFARLPNFDRFPTVDEMWADLDDIAGTLGDRGRLRRVGTSRLGEPLRMLTIPGGPKNALVLGGPHPNEAVGALTVSHLARLLAADQGLLDGLDFTWHFIPCVDPDGARLNEGWFDAPGDRRRYSRHFYRPNLDEQVEYTYPHTDESLWFDRTLPETAALMRLIDELRPELVCSLHNGEYNGMFWLMYPASAELAGKLRGLTAWQGLAEQHAEPEAVPMRSIEPAVFEIPMLREMVTAVAAAGGRPDAFLAGAGPAEYAARFGTLTLMAEVPYWHDPRFQDTGDSGRTLAQLLADYTTNTRASLREITDVLDAVSPDLTVDSPFRRSLRGSLAFADATINTSTPAALEGPVGARPATVAQSIGAEERVYMWRLRLTGTLLRVLDAELAAGNVTPRVRESHRRATELFEGWCDGAEAEFGGEPIELGRLVAVQAAGALLAAAHLRNQ